MIHRCFERLVQVAIVAMIMALVGVFILMHGRARAHFYECVRAKGYTVECLAEYEMERPR